MALYLLNKLIKCEMQTQKHDSIIEKEKKMRKIKSALIGLMVGFALVCTGSIPAIAGEVGPMCWAGFCPDMSKAITNSGPYPCGVASPAYTFYYNASAVACPSSRQLPVTLKTKAQ